MAWYLVKHRHNLFCETVGQGIHLMLHFYLPLSINWVTTDRLDLPAQHHNFAPQLSSDTANLQDFVTMKKLTIKLSLKEVSE
jgi:hypothetical protein